MSARFVSVGAALEAVREVVASCGRSSITSLQFNHAQSSLIVALQTAEERIAFLNQLSLARKRGEISKAAYEKILMTVGKLLKGSADLVSEMERVCSRRND